MKQTVAVYGPKRRLVGYVSWNATSIGASKLTGQSMKRERVNGVYAWIPANNS
jgi:hypothetical protein